MNTSTITINGVTTVIQSSSSSITIRNGRVVVDGKDLTPDGKEINITVTGDVPTLTVDACQLLTVNGNAGTIRTASGDVEVSGSAQGVTTASGDVDCGDVTGSVTTASGDVSCGKVGGSVTSMSGRIKHSK